MSTNVAMENILYLGFQQMLRGPPPRHRGVLQGLGPDGAHTLRG